jgi:hypothetical protein
MIIEIGYSYQSDNQGPALDSWTYFYVKGDDFDKNKKKAQTYWKKFIADLGWQKKAKLVHIQEIQNGKNYTPSHIIVDSRELPPARKRTSTPKPSKSRAPRTSRASSTSRTTRTSARKK